MPTSIGQRIRDAREAAGLTTREVAEATGVGHSWLRAAEAERFDRPNPRWTLRVWRFLRLPEDELLPLLAGTSPRRVYPPPADSPQFDPLSDIERLTLEVRRLRWEQADLVRLLRQLLLHIPDDEPPPIDGEVPHAPENHV